MDQSGLNLIRVVIGSYFCAIALGVPSGFDPHFLLGLILPDAVARVLGSVALLALSVTFICGVMLRSIALILAGFLISSCLGTAMTGDVHPGTGMLWQSCAFAAAILLCYGPLKPHEIHKAALFSTVNLRGGAARVLQKDVAPRRVTARDRAAKREERGVRSLRPLIAPTEKMIGLGGSEEARTDKPPRGRPEPIPLVEDDLDNIFVNL
ncbi:MAG: hypothetical protein AAFY25_13780 [Pseudomonadota bacterium]